MKHLEPKKMLVNSMTVVSHFKVKEVNDEGEPVTVLRERRVFLGYFEPRITFRSIENALTEHKLWLRVITADSFDADGFRSVYANLREITEGVIFEETAEFIECLKKGIRYDDLMEGYQMANGEISVQI